MVVGPPVPISRVRYGFLGENLFCTVVEDNLESLEEIASIGLLGPTNRAYLNRVLLMSHYMTQKWKLSAEATCLFLRLFQINMKEGYCLFLRALICIRLSAKYH